jgi:hypothetical protein
MLCGQLHEGGGGQCLVSIRPAPGEAEGVRAAASGGQVVLCLVSVRQGKSESAAVHPTDTLQMLAGWV